MKLRKFLVYYGGYEFWLKAAGAFLGILYSFFVGFVMLSVVLSVKLRFLVARYTRFYFYFISVFVPFHYTSGYWCHVDLVAVRD